MKRWIVTYFLLTFIITGCGRKSLQGQEKMTVTADYLEDCWVNDYGFYCQYYNGIYTDRNGCSYEKNKLTENGLYVEQGDNNNTLFLEIDILDSDTMKIGFTTVYRVGSDKGEQCLEQLRANMLGLWDYCGDNREYVIEITEEEIKLNRMIYGETNNRDDEFPYRFLNGKIIMMPSDYDEELLGFLQIDKDELSVHVGDNHPVFYRHES